MSTLYIIGNGFDLHHGVLSSYGNFASWLRKHDRRIFETYKRVCDYDALWQDFERGMAYVDRRYFIDMAEPFLPSLKGREPDDLQMAEIYLSGDWATSFAVELVDKLKSRFTQWIKSIELPEDYRDKMIALDKTGRFITFNYTDFLETQYRIPDKNVKHIHGKSGIGNLIVGHGEDTHAIFDKWYDKINRHRPIYKKGKKIYIPTPYLKYYKEPTCYIPEYEYLTERLEIYYEQAQKPVDEIIKQEGDYFETLKDIDAIMVLGFSFSNVDMPYLKKIIAVNETPHKIKWTVSRFSDADVNRAEAALNKLGIDEKNISFISLNDILSTEVI